MTLKKIDKLKKHLLNLERGKKAMDSLIQKEEEAWFLQAYLHQYDKEKGGIIGEDFNDSKELRFIPIRPHMGPKRELHHRFQVIKKQKKDLLRLEKAILTATQLLETLTSTPSESAAPKEPSSQKKEPISERKPYFRFFSTEGDEIWVGRSARENEILTFQLARGDDLWLHISGKKGPHLLIPKPKNKTISPKTLQEAFQLVLHYSGKLSSGEITVSTKKHVHKKKGDKTGTVTLSSMKNYLAKKEGALLETLLQSRFTQPIRM